MSDDKKFVTLSKSQSWADEEAAPVASNEPKATKTWGTVQNVKAVSIAEQMEAEPAKKDAPAPRQERAPRSNDNYGGGGRDYGGGRSDYGGRSGGGDRDYGGRSGGGDRDYGGRSGGGDREYGNRGAPRESREPRQKNPVPDHPPFVAFLGNLAYSVTEDSIWEYFGELGVDSVRMVNDQETGKPKGFAYVHFKDQEGLKNALTCDGIDFYGRNLNVDVAAAKTGGRDGGSREDRTAWGPRPGGDGGRRPFGSGGFGPRGGDRDRDHAPAERKPLNLAPRTVKPEEAKSEESAKPAAAGGADPFGGAAADRAKMDQIAKERLQKEQEREQRRKDELKAAEERRQKEREERERAKERPAAAQPRRDGPAERAPREAPPKSEKEAEIDSKNSWRSDKKPEDGPKRGGFGGGRGGYSGGRGGGNAGASGKPAEKKWVEDSDGFKTKKEETKPAPASWAAVAKSTAPASADDKGAVNPYDALGGDE